MSTYGFQTSCQNDEPIMNSFKHLPGSFKPPKVLLPKQEHFARSRDRSRRCISLGSGAVKSKADKALK